jgi:hypothetical protein|tara:strand:+ start:2332 stop:2574 length:243 start_codon:yes stop_codon:yes gene_type:complete
MGNEKEWLENQLDSEEQLLADCQELCNIAVSNMLPKVREKALENGLISDLNITLKFDLKRKPKISADTFVPPIIEKCRKF